MVLYGYSEHIPFLKQSPYIQYVYITFVDKSKLKLCVVYFDIPGGLTALLVVCAGEGCVGDYVLLIGITMLLICMYLVASQRCLLSAQEKAVQGIMCCLLGLLYNAAYMYVPGGLTALLVV